MFSLESLEQRRLLCAATAQNATAQTTGGAVAAQVGDLAPVTISGMQANITITAGTSPIIPASSYAFSADSATTYSLKDSLGNSVTTGSYSYVVNSPTTATITFTTSLLPGTFTINLTFTSASAGTF